MVGIREIPHDLVERVESGTGSDRLLDKAIDVALYPDTSCEPVDWTRRYTISLDAVVTLIEAKLPEITDNSAADFLAASIDEMLVRGWRPSEPNIPQICRAVLAAFLRALQEARTLADAHSKNPPEAEHG